MLFSDLVLDFQASEIQLILNTLISVSEDDNIIVVLMLKKAMTLKRSKLVKSRGSDSLGKGGARWKKENICFKLVGHS